MHSILPPKLLMLALLPLVTACNQTTGSSGTDAMCRAFQPIYWSGTDTAETIRQAKAHNAVGVAVCRWKGAK